MSRFTSVFMIVCLIFLASVRSSEAQPPEMQAILEDFDLTQVDLMTLGAIINGRMEELKGKFEDRFKEPPTLQNYREKVGMIIDELGPAVTGIIREEVRDFLTPEQYQKLETRVLQAHTTMLNDLEQSEDRRVIVGNWATGMLQMTIGPPSFLEFTDEQKQKLLELQKRTILDCTGAGLELKEQFPDGPGSPGFPEAVMKKFRPILLRFKKEYEKILTDKQKSQIEGVMNDMPDYLWKMMPQNRGKERAWRPGAKSWKPGDGAPEGMNTGREAKPDRPKKEKTFPGAG
ncbi:MAG: hypothetical protein FWC50_04875 [Planctomycetaceae bacterium]|nr:hypothetical protein [Planctomycetaceae bacterium]